MASGAAQFYQLTHDYLVPSLCTWLTRRQRETRRGRAELRLAERAALWNAKPENRHLPAWWEWANIRLLKRKLDWTAPQRRMMRRATHFHAVRGMILAGLLAAAALIGLDIRDRVREHQHAAYAQGLVNRLLDANIAGVPAIVPEFDDYRAWADPLLRQEHEQAAPDSPQKLRTSLALLPVDPSQVDYLYGRLLHAAPAEVPVLRAALRPHRDELLGRLWPVVEQSARGKEEQRLRAACALALYDPDSPRWDKAGALVVEQLVAENAVHLGLWLEGFRPVSGRLLAPLAGVFRDRRDGRSAERSLATNLLADYAAGRPAVLADLLMDADDKQFAILYPRFQALGEQGPALLQEEVDKQLQLDWRDPPLDQAWHPVDAALVRQIEADGQGLVMERLALCQTLPLKEFLAAAEGLRASGYRPIRFRPYAVAASGPLALPDKPASEPLAATVQVAAVWTRDGLPWQLAHGLSAEALRQRDGEQAKQHFQPVDVAAYLDQGAEHYVALWVKAPAKGDAALLAVGLDDKQLKDKEEALGKDGYRRAVYSLLTGADGKTRSSLVWTKTAGPAGKEEYNFIGVEPNYDGDNYLGEMQVDVQLSASLNADKVERRYAAVWHPGLTRNSAELHGLEPRVHLARCRALMVQGYRPMSVSVAAFSARPGRRPRRRSW